MVGPALDEAPARALRAAGGLSAIVGSMIRHVVMFQLTAAADSERAADISQMQERLGALVGVIPGLRSMSLKPDLGLVEGHWDVVLVSEHDDNAALEGYQAHPAHVEVSNFIKSVTSSERVAVDYEL